MFKTLMRPVQIFDLTYWYVGDKVEYISADEKDRYYDPESETHIYDWGYGEISTLSMDKVGIHYYSELDTYVDHNRQSIEKEWRYTVLTPKMILEDGYTLKKL